jgi:hypothetical protein
MDSIDGLSVMMFFRAKAMRVNTDVKVLHRTVGDEFFRY